MVSAGGRQDRSGLRACYVDDLDTGHQSSGPGQRSSNYNQSFAFDSVPGRVYIYDHGRAFCDQLTCCWFLSILSVGSLVKLWDSFVKVFLSINANLYIVCISVSLAWNWTGLHIIWWEYNIMWQRMAYKRNEPKMKELHSVTSLTHWLSDRWSRVIIGTRLNVEKERRAISWISLRCSDQ